jgi:hypothetical protein
MAAEQGFACANADCTVIADTPRLAPTPRPWSTRLTAVLGRPVSVKATRAEGLGALGRAEGIACLAVVCWSGVTPPRGGGVRAARGWRRWRRRGGGGPAAVEEAGWPCQGRRWRRGGDRTAAEGARPDQREPSELGGDQVEGRRAVLELLSVGRRTVRQILLAEDQDPSPQLDRIEELAARMRIPSRRCRVIGSMPRPAPRRPRACWPWPGPLEPVALEDLCAPSRQGVQPFLLVAAGITDPRNLGALLRSAECAGVTGVVLPRHRSARLSPDGGQDGGRGH